MDARQFFVGLAFRFGDVDRSMLVLACQAAVARPAVGNHRRAGLHIGADEALQRNPPGVRDNPEAAAPVALRLSDLNCHGHKTLAQSPTATWPLFVATHVRFIHLDREGSTELDAFAVHHC